MAYKEIIFTNTSPNSSGKELHFGVDQRNIVTWQIIPEGESGATRPFRDIAGAEGFMERYAIRLGFPNRLVQVEPEILSERIPVLIPT